MRITLAVLIIVLATASCEDDNRSSGGRSDLCVDLLDLPDGVDDSAVFTVAWEVSNIGTAWSPSTSAYIDVYDIDWNWHKGYSLSDVPALYPGEVLYDYAGMRIRNDVPVAGTFFVVVTIDPLNYVVELNEYNNQSAGVLEVW